MRHWGFRLPITLHCILIDVLYADKARDCWFCFFCMFQRNVSCGSFCVRFRVQNVQKYPCKVKRSFSFFSLPSVQLTVPVLQLALLTSTVYLGTNSNGIFKDYPHFVLSVPYYMSLHCNMLGNQFSTGKLLLLQK